MSGTAAAETRPVVAFAMEWVPQYRLRFYEELRRALAARGIEMRLIHGDPPNSRKQRNDAKVVPWADYRPNRLWTVRGLELTAQPVLELLKGVDLVVLQQETGLLLNYVMLGKARLNGPRVALWGHGHNFNPLEASGLAEAVKRRVTKWADWAFAYTTRSAEVFESIGVDPTHITVVQNSLDIGPIRNPTEPVSADVERLAAELREGGAKVGWIVSALDGWKRVPFLLEILDICAVKIEDFAFVALGAGEHAHLLAEAAESRPWLHVLGARFGADKAAIGELASVTIHPGLAGLHVIESFATESPMITADMEYHSHEVSYLSPKNSVVLGAGAEAADFADAVKRLLEDDEALHELQAGCRDAADTYSLEAMVDNFASGIVEALATYRRV
jgi:glycosyltransferase involved in cell wall biosynthesis